MLRIPKEESAKNTDNWTVSITDRTASALSRWLAERSNHRQYAEMTALWLTREGNPYQSSSLNYILRQVCDIAGISTEHRSLSWYSIRHSVGTYMNREESFPGTMNDVFATATGGEFSLVSRHCDRYMSWPRVRLAVLERDGYQCQYCRACQKYIERPLSSSGFSTFITYSGRNLRPCHFANPNERPTIAHSTSNMVTLCFDCY